MTLHRRDFLRGAAGAALALPWLEITSRKASAAELPPAFLLCSGGFSLGVERGELPELLTPHGADTLQADNLPPELSPFADLAGELSVVSGLRIPGEGPDGLPSAGGRHSHEDSFHHHFNPLLSGNRQIGDARDSRVDGPTVDEVAADAFYGRTLFRKLTYRAQPQFYYFDGVPEYTYLSYQKIDDRIWPVPAQISPRLAWLELTGGIVPSDPSLAAQRVRDLERRRSVLDLVDRRSAVLAAKLGADDRARLERHYDEVRALELRLATPPQADDGVCSIPQDPGSDPAIGASGYSGEDARARAFNDLVRFAFACDLTRSASLMYTYWKTYMSTLAIAGYDWTIHDVLHSGTRLDLIPIVRWHADIWADLVRKLRDTPEGEGSLLDRVSCVYLTEGGYSVNEVSQLTTSHSCDNMVVMTAGRAGGLQTGKHIVAPPGFNHPVNVALTALRAAGVDVASHGEVVGEVPGLRA